MLRQQKITTAKNRRLVGQTVQVLIDGTGTLEVDGSHPGLYGGTPIDRYYIDSLQGLGSLARSRHDASSTQSSHR